MSPPILLTRKVGPQTLAARCSKVFEGMGEQLLERLAALAGKGKGLADGVTIQYGFSKLTLRQVDDLLVVHEPVFRTCAHDELVPFVDATLLYLDQQLDLCNSCRVQPQECSCYQRMVLATGCLEAERLTMCGVEPTADDDSGWSLDFADREETPRDAQLGTIHAIHLAHHRPQLLRALFLPVGCFVNVEGDRFVAIGDAEDRILYSETAA
jgi:hypothetical protein